MLLAVSDRGLGLEAQEGRPQLHAGLFQHFHRVERHDVLPVIRHMNQAQDVPAPAKGNQGHRLVAHLVADVTRDTLIRLIDGGQKAGGAVHIEGAAGGIEGEPGVAGALDDIDAHAVIGMNRQGAFPLVERPAEA